MPDLTFKLILVTDDANLKLAEVKQEAVSAQSVVEKPVSVKITAEQALATYNKKKEKMQEEIQKAVEAKDAEIAKLQAEMASLHYQLETVKQTGLFGYYIEDFETWVRYCAADVYKTVNIEPPFVVPETHRLTYMDTWLNNDNFQQAPQEEDSINYIFGPLIRDDKNKIYPINF